MRGMRWSVWVVGGVWVLTGCATNNGMAPQTQGMVSRYPALASAPTPSLPERRAPVAGSQVSPSAAPGAPSAAQNPSGAKTSFFGEWQADMTKARQGSARCAAMSSTAQPNCWRGVSIWARKRADRYQALSTQATGVRAQRMRSAAKFFGVTSEWASACGALTAQQCAESPLIGKMQEWKASVDTPGAAAPTP